MESKKSSFLDFLLILTKWRVLIIVNFLVVGIISVIISLQMQLWYKSTAIILPPTDQVASGGLSALLGNLPLGGLGLGMGSGNDLTFMGILKSRSFAEDVIMKYNLKEFYEKETMEETYLSFYNDYDAQFTEENMISLSFVYSDSIKVAEIVNYMVELLKERAGSLMLKKAKGTKDFIEKRYFENLSKIDSLANSLEEFGKKYGVIEFGEQTKAMINVIASAESQVYIKEAELEALGNSIGKNTKAFQDGKYSLESLKKQVEKMKYEYGKSTESGPFASLFMPIDEIPTLGKKYSRMQGELLIQIKLQEYILPEYEQAKLQLLKEDPGIQIIDYAKPPDRKYAPKRAFIVAGAVLISSILVIIFILLMEKINSLKESDKDSFEKFISLKRKWFFSK